MEVNFVKIKKIIKSEKETKMVDLTVEDNHNFILANGICVCNSAMIDINVLRLADVILLKEPSLLQARFERKAIQEMYEKILELFKAQTEREKYFYIWSDDFEGLARYNLPEFWNESISKGFRKLNDSHK